MVFIGALSVCLSIVQLPIAYIMFGDKVREDDLIAFWFFEHGFDPFIWVGDKLKERNLI
jgi:hypothetical protein